MVCITSVQNEDQPSSLSSTSAHFSPQDIRPFPKAVPRKTMGGRKKAETLILTDTQVKNRIQQTIRDRKTSKLAVTKEQKQKKQSVAVKPHLPLPEVVSSDSD